MEEARAELGGADEARCSRAFEEALERFARGAALAPGVARRVGFHLQRGFAQLGAGDARSALESAEKALRREHDSSQALQLKGIALRVLGRLYEAEASFRAAGPAATAQLAHLLLLQGRPAEARVICSANHAHAHNARLLARLEVAACAQEGLDEEAAPAAERLLDMLDANSRSDSDVALVKDLSRVLSLAAAAHATFEIETRLRFAKRACVEHPSHRNTIALGSLYREAGDFEKAEQVLLLACKMHPKDSQVYVELGLLQFTQGKFRLAAAQFQKALELTQRYPGHSSSPTGIQYRGAAAEREAERIRGSINLYLGIALLNGGAISQARGPIQSAASSIGAAIVRGRLVGAILHIMDRNFFSAMNSLDIVRSDIDHAVFEARGRTASVQCNAAFVEHNVESKEAHPAPIVVDRVSRLHLATAKLAELAGLNGEKPKDECRKFQIRALRDAVERDEALSFVEIELRELESLQKKSRPKLQRSISAKEPSIERLWSTEEQKRKEAADEVTRKEFVESLIARRRALSHEHQDGENFHEE